MPEMPMFPLGSVLFPGMPLALRVFEERYLKMMGHVLEEQVPRFGVVLIERGFEVGGGDHRFGVGTIAEVLQVEAPDGPLAVVARGARRFQVTSWVAEEPFPIADVEFLPDLEWEEGLEDTLSGFEETVRSILEELSQEGHASWPSTIDLAEDPIVRLWQLVGISPIGTLDHQDLLVAASARELLDTAVTVVGDAWDAFQATRRTTGENSEE